MNESGAVSMEQLTKIFSRTQIARVSLFFQPLVDTMRKHDISTPQRISMFLANIAVETAGLMRIEENLNYSAVRLLEVFPSHFTEEQAAQYARRPEAIANRVYANRYGNGPESSGDGWKYRGRGLPQLTFRDNYRMCGQDLGLPLESTPSLLVQDLNAATESAGWFWEYKHVAQYADAGDVRAARRAWQGGAQGMAEVEWYYAGAMRVLQ